MQTKLRRIQQDIEALSAYNATPGAGLTRFSFSPEHRAAADYIMKRMREAGLAVREDAVGTVVGRLEGRRPDAPVVMMGSHFDSVRNGGNFDGPAGVVAALETARVLAERGVTPEHPVEFVAMVEEEGARFGGGLFASRAMAGRLTAHELETFQDGDGVTVGEAMRAFGLDPARCAEAARAPGSVKGFLELHIEQGPVLESAGADVGVVDVIVGIRELKITLTGRPDHAGTTPMDMRADAYLAACRVALAANEAAVAAGRGTVATVGKVEVLPGSFNIVPGRVVFYIDIRSPETGCIGRVVDAVTARLESLCAGNPALRADLRTMMEVAPVAMDPHLRSLLTQNAEALGLTCRAMLSGAGHDAMVMADVAPAGLLFVPSRGGRSHCPEEWTDYEQLQKGVEAVCRAVLALADGD